MGIQANNITINYDYRLDYWLIISTHFPILGNDHDIDLDLGITQK